VIRGYFTQALSAITLACRIVELFTTYRACIAAASIFEQFVGEGLVNIDSNSFVYSLVELH
jgi:hypothetical protein